MILLGEESISGADLRGGAIGVEPQDDVVIDFGAIQARNLADRWAHVTIIGDGGGLGRRQKFSLLEQPAEILFARAHMNALLAIPRGRGFVFNAEALQSNDAEELIADFPDLGLT